jgi:uncharacterized protein (DUF2062 family)
MGKAKKRKTSERLRRLLKFVYIKLFRINDSPLKIALGFGLGVFIGVMPGIGPVIALLLALLLRVNRASALLGCILFNTWLGIMILLFAIKTGSAVMGLNYQDVYDGWSLFLKNFNWKNLFELSVYKVLIPIGVGYFIISFCLGVLMALAVFIIARKIRNKKRSQIKRMAYKSM